MAEVAPPPEKLTIEDMPWPEIELPPTDLPYDDGDKMESSWHADTCALLKASVIAAHSGRRDDYYVASNMFVYYSLEQVRNKDYRGPDVFVVKNVDGLRYRDSWIAWVEGGHRPDLVFELLSPISQDADLGTKKHIYEQVFRASEYFCIAPEVERLFGWRLERRQYVPIAPNERGWLWSEELGVWLGPWQGVYLTEEHIWPRFYTADGSLILLPDEAERQRAEAAQAQAEAERQRAERLAAKLRALGIDPDAE